MLKEDMLIEHQYQLQEDQMKDPTMQAMKMVRPKK